MDEKEQDIATENMGVSSENPEEGEVISEGSTLDLRTIRESKGITLRDVSSSTRISPSNLKAIEEQRFELLPEPIYARAFIETYARVLDVDGKQILSLYEKYLEGLDTDKDKYEVLKKITAKKHHEVRIWIIIISGLVALIGAFFIYQWSTSGRQAEEGPSPVAEIEGAGGGQIEPEENIPAGESGPVAVEGEDKPQEVKSAPSADLPAADSTQGTDQEVEEDRRPVMEDKQPKEVAVPDTAVPAEEKPYILVIEASELTWIEIFRDREPSFEVMLRPGERITERASEGFGLIIGNAGGVNIRFQERSLGPLGEHGEVVHLILPANE